MSFTFRFKPEPAAPVAPAATKNLKSKEKCKCKCKCNCGAGGGGIVANLVLTPGVDSWLTTSTTADPLNSDFYAIDASGGSITLTFPDATTADGQFVYVKRVDTSSGNTVTLDTNTLGQTIDGTSSVTLAPGESRFVLSINGNWH